MTSPRPYHHGNLRRAVLDVAMERLHEVAASELSLRELTGEIGVSHAAPRRYFPDRQALLDALATEGFARIGARLREATAEGNQQERIRAIARAYLDFTAAEPNLVELMFAHKRDADRDSIAHSAVEAFSPLLEVFPSADPAGAQQTGTTFLATLQGLASLIACGVVQPEQIEALVEDIVGRYGTDLA
ncbi:AcrR family transcriptional regulator [Microbacterium sp. W4I4]|uniref:TetR/AcrR family transcriptional regulator n=1 Tax=Microbacterium sp. W4I4 TaxID=3042295 RepID=UPI002781A492|nr:TetR/AcrR family transcriptional regulator [Microbacterium sp. W4I4]MDQ0613913.1 AcrR family transcriptional regulator [Microbacterium sp. W4I4]